VAEDSGEQLNEGGKQELGPAEDSSAGTGLADTASADAAGRGTAAEGKAAKGKAVNGTADEGTADEGTADEGTAGDTAAGDTAPPDAAMPGGSQIGSDAAAAIPPTGQTDTPPAGRAQRIWVRVILAFATLLAVLAIFAIWANRQLLNPTNWSNTSTALLQKATIRSAVSGYLVDQVYANINVSDQIKSGLPSELQKLAGPISGALHGVAEQGAERALEIPQVQSVWRRANHVADQTLVTIVNGGGSRVKIQGGTVSLNLRQIVADLSERLGLPSDLAAKLPASVGNVKVITSHQLGLVRNVAKAIHALALWLTIVTVALYALALYLARGYRRRVLMWIGLSLVLAGVIVLIARKIAQGQIVPAVTKDASIEPAANDAYSVATSLLAQVAGAAIFIGVPVILAGWFAGPTRWAVAGRRFSAPYLRKRPNLAYWITAGLLSLLFIWGPIPSTRNPITMLLYAILAFVGAYVLRNQIAAEFPDVPAVSARAALSEYAQVVGEKVSRMRAATAPRGAGPPSDAAAPSKADEIERLLALREKGAITDDEYAAAKRELFVSA
jgi:hypothetical protein